MSKASSDLEKMKKDRRRAEEEYLNTMNRRIEVERITREGIKTQGELILYLRERVDGAKITEDAAKLSNNLILYSEANAIQREFRFLLSLIMLPEVEAETQEEAHRQNTDGGEAYV